MTLIRCMGQPPGIEVADMIKAVAATGVAGCSIEDYIGNPESAIFDRSLAIERIQAAHEARLSLADDFVLMSTPDLPYGLSDLQAIGVCRVSIGSSIAQLIYGNAIKAISELAQFGTFNFLNEVMDYQELEDWFIDSE